MCCGFTLHYFSSRLAGWNSNFCCFFFFSLWHQYSSDEEHVLDAQYTIVRTYLQTRSHSHIKTVSSIKVGTSAKKRSETTKDLYISKECNLFPWPRQPFPHNHKTWNRKWPDKLNQSHVSVAFTPDAAEVYLFSRLPGISSRDCSHARKQFSCSTKCTELQGQVEPGVGEKMQVCKQFKFQIDIIHTEVILAEWGWGWGYLQQPQHACAVWMKTHELFF